MNLKKHAYILRRFMRRYPLTPKTVERLESEEVIDIRFAPMAVAEGGVGSQDGKHWYIYVRENSNRESQKITISHEIAHVVYNSLFNKILQRYGSDSITDKALEYLIEREAQRFCKAERDFMENFYQRHKPRLK